MTAKQAGVLLVLGLLYAASSLCLFGAYNYIASGLATTLVFLSPVLVAIIMACLGVVPSWPVWLAIVATFGGVFIMAQGSGDEVIDPWGVVLSLGSALAYALFVVVINRSKAIAGISHTLLTFYALAVGVVVFLGKMLVSDAPVTAGIDSGFAWMCIVGHALLPTIVSIATLAVSARNIGATKATVLGVFEPIAAILVGTIVFNEPLTLSIVAGICISIVAVTVMIALTKR